MDLVLRRGKGGGERGEKGEGRRRGGGGEGGGAGNGVGSNRLRDAVWTIYCSLVQCNIWLKAEPYTESTV